VPQNDSRGGTRLLTLGSDLAVDTGVTFLSSNSKKQEGEIILKIEAISNYNWEKKKGRAHTYVWERDPGVSLRNGEGWTLAAVCGSLAFLILFNPKELDVGNVDFHFYIVKYIVK